MKKKFAALLLSVAMGMSLIACGSQNAGSDGKQTTVNESQATNVQADADSEEEAGDASDWPVITVPVLIVRDVPAEESVEEHLNDYLVSINAGVQADIIPINIGDMSTQLTLGLSDNTNPLDLFTYTAYSTLDNCVKNEQCISLEPYLEEYADLWESYPDKVLQTQKIDGIQYAVPDVSSYSGYTIYMLRADIAEEMGLTDRDGEEITMDELTQIMKDAKALHPEYAYIADTADGSVQGIDSLNNDDWLGVLMNRGIGTREIVNYYDTPEWRDYCYRMKEWNEAGLMCDDPLNNFMDVSQYTNGVAAGCYMRGYSEDSIRTLVAYTHDHIQFKLTDLCGNSGSVGAGWMISSVCKNPDAAMKLLYLMATDENVARYFILGVEGENYVVDENGIARYPEGVDNATSEWMMDMPWYWPNQCLSLPFETDMTDYYKDMQKASENAQLSEAMGFVFDSANVYDQMAACSTVVAEYRPALLYGLVDVDEYLNKFIQELKDSGIDAIIAEEQKQFDEFLAAQER